MPGKPRDWSGATVARGAVEAEKGEAVMVEGGRAEKGRVLGVMVKEGGA